MDAGNIPVSDAAMITWIKTSVIAARMTARQGKSLELDLTTRDPDTLIRLFRLSIVVIAGMTDVYNMSDQTVLATFDGLEAAERANREW